MVVNIGVLVFLIFEYLIELVYDLYIFNLVVSLWVNFVKGYILMELIFFCFSFYVFDKVVVIVLMIVCFILNFMDFRMILVKVLLILFVIFFFNDRLVVIVIVLVSVCV